jgi:hypothetical protein
MQFILLMCFVTKSLSELRFPYCQFGNLTALEFLNNALSSQNVIDVLDLERIRIQQPPGGSCTPPLLKIDLGTSLQVDRLILKGNTFDSPILDHMVDSITSNHKLKFLDLSGGVLHNRLSKKFARYSCDKIAVPVMALS